MANPRKFSEKIALHNQKQAEETAEFEKIMKEVSDATSKSAMGNNNEVLQTLPSANSNYRERARSTVGPMRSRPIEKRTDTSPYNSCYLSPPLEGSWRRTHSDSALHTSSQEQVQRRGGVDVESHFSDPLRRNISVSQDGRPNSDLPRTTGISALSSQSDSGHIPIGKNTGSLPDLTSFHFPSPLNSPLDEDERGSSPFQNSLHGNTVPSTFFAQQLRTTKFSYMGSPPQEAPGPPHTPPQYNNHVVGQVCHQYIYQPLSPLQQPNSQSVTSQAKTALNSYRTPVTRPSPQASPSLSVRFGVTGSPRSGSPQSPSSPGTVSPFPDHSNYFVTQTNALQHHFEQFTMTDDSCTQITSDPGYFSTSPSHPVHYANRGSSMVNTQTAPNTPSSIPDIVLTDFSSTDGLTKDLGVSLETELLSDDCLREGLVPIDLDGLQMLTDPDLIADPATEDHFRLDRL